MQWNRCSAGKHGKYGKYGKYGKVPDPVTNKVSIIRQINQLSRGTPILALGLLFSSELSANATLDWPGCIWLTISGDDCFSIAV